MATEIKARKSRDKAQLVEIQASRSNKYASVMRACITAANACKSVGDTDQMRQFLKLHSWASQQWKATL